jgi:hypothetical protein
MKFIFSIYLFLIIQIGFTQDGADNKQIKKWQKQREFVIDNAITEISVITYINWKGEDKPCHETIYKYNSKGLIVSIEIWDHCVGIKKYDGILKYHPNNLCDSTTSDRGNMIKAVGNRQYPTATVYTKSKLKNGMIFKKEGLKRMIKLKY